MSKLISHLVILIYCFSLGQARISLSHSKFSEENAYDLELDLDQAHVKGKLGISFPEAVGQWTECASDDPNNILCVQWSDFARFTAAVGTTPNCVRVEWTSSHARELEDCYDLEAGVHWYGGSEMYTQVWPLENHPRLESACVTANSLGDTEREFAGVVENYWLLSNGFALVMDRQTPLFYSLNSTRSNRVCFKAKDDFPFSRRSPLTMAYEWCARDNVKTVHKEVMSTFYAKPTGIPDEIMLVRPLWSTWVRFGFGVDQEKVLDFANKVISEGFVNSSHMEIDDDWETCYGDVRFKPEKFPNPSQMVEEIKNLGLRTTVWVHPFIRMDCVDFKEGMEKGYFLKGQKGYFGLTGFGGSRAISIDSTNPEAMDWWSERLDRLKNETGVESFKFDYGESSFLPASPVFSSDSKLWPNIYSTKYAEAVARFGGLIETRVGHHTQHLPIFVRTLDKDSKWGYDNGLRSMIPSVLQFGIVGYPFILPDMIGGNPKPEKELFIRWMQANIFFPSVQFSTAPWDFDQETVDICKFVLEERERFKDAILEAARISVEEEGTPMIRPIWWIDPTDTDSFTIDDEYLLGDNILVAPVLDEGRVSRDIFIPRGTWVNAQKESEEYIGPQWIRDYPAPLHSIPFFLRRA